MDDGVYNEPQAARVLRVSLSTLQRYRKRGQIGFHRTPTGRISYTIDQLAEFTAKCRHNASA